MDLLVILLIVVVAIVVVAAVFVFIRKKQRSGSVFATPGSTSSRSGSRSGDSS